MERLGLSTQTSAVVWEKAWNVNCKAVGDGRLALPYLAPYVFRVAIRAPSESRTGVIELFRLPNSPQKIEAIKDNRLFEISKLGNSRKLAFH